MVANNQIIPLHTEETEQVAINGRAVLYAKLARVMGSVSRIPKSGYNEHFKYKFAADADVSDLIRVELAKEGVAFFANMLEVKQEMLTFTSEYQGKTSSKQQLKTTVTFEFTFACGETGAVKTCIWQSEAMDTQDKGINKAATAAVKYFLLKTFLISTGDPADDPDGDEPAQDKATPKAQRRIPQPVPPPAPERTEAGQETDTSAQPEAKADKSSSQFQWLMKNVNHPRYQDSRARAKAILKLQAADLIFEAQPHEQALKLVMAYGNLRENDVSENDAMLEVRKLANGGEV